MVENVRSLLFLWSPVFEIHPRRQERKIILIPSEVARPRRARSDLVFMVGSEIPSSSDLATVSILIGAFELFWW